VIEAWIGLSSGGRPAQQAFYVYDELSQNPAHAGTQNVVSTINGKAASLAALGKFDEAKKVLEEGRTLVSVESPENHFSFFFFFFFFLGIRFEESDTTQCH